MWSYACTSVHFSNGVQLGISACLPRKSSWEPAREHSTVLLISDPQRPKVELTAIKMWNQRKKQLPWNSGNHGTINEATSACQEGFVYSFQNYVPRFYSSAGSRFYNGPPSQAASRMLLISPRHQRGQLFSSTVCMRSHKLDVTHDGHGQKTGKKSAF